MDASHDEPAADDLWAGERARRWVAQWEALDRQLGPVSEQLFGAAALRPGERVLDVGCGTGPTTRRIAEAVGATGSVVGVDVAAEMLEAARQVPVAPGAAPIEWVLADATTWPGAGAPFDLVLSRFGVMFFADPDAAFANLRRLMAPGGRLCIVTWQKRSASALFELPFSVVRAHGEAHGLDVPDLPPDGGPFSLHEPAVRALLERTGWTQVTTRPHMLDLPVGGRLGPVDAAASSLESGPSRIATADLDDHRLDELRAAVADAFADHVDADGAVHLSGAVVVTTALA